MTGTSQADGFATDAAFDGAAAPASDTPSPYLSSALKRAVDVAGSLGLIVLLAPLLAIIAIAIVTDTPGGPLYRQTRYGWRGKRFQILKFRSMARSSPDAAFLQASRSDPRITRVGRFIRRTSLDELPQLFNVLRGDMSLVGPRPHVMPLDDAHAALIPGFMNRYAARPGITGFAQVSGARGETPTLAHMQRRIEFDLRYTREASFLLDLRILLATVREVFASSEAF